MSAESLILVVNPGSASRKYALFSSGHKLANINFEFVDGRVAGSIKYGDQKHPVVSDDTDLTTVSRYILPLLHEYKVISDNDKIEAVAIRVVAPSDDFTKDQMVTDEVISALEVLQQKAPLHITTALSEIKHLKTYFTDTPIVAISDSAFHITKPQWASNYAIDTELANKFGIKRYGYHGISVGSVVRVLHETDSLKPKTIVCHLGSGSSITAVVDGKSVDTTMGYSPLEGLMMASRSGNIDVSAALGIKRELKLTDEELEKYLNKQSGLIGVSGSSDDIRQLLTSEDQGDERARLALKMLIYRIQQAIGQMAASMGGVDCLVFTATIGERSSVIRERVLENMDYLGFKFDKALNDKAFEPAHIANIAISGGKPILVVSTNESVEIARRADKYINNLS